MKIILYIALLVVMYFGCANWVVVANKLRYGDNFIFSLFFGLIFTVPPLVIFCAGLLQKFFS